MGLNPSRATMDLADVLEVLNRFGVKEYSQFLDEGDPKWNWWHPGNRLKFFPVTSNGSSVSSDLSLEVNLHTGWITFYCGDRVLHRFSLEEVPSPKKESQMAHKVWVARVSFRDVVRELSYLGRLFLRWCVSNPVVCGAMAHACRVQNGVRFCNCGKKFELERGFSGSLPLKMSIRVDKVGSEWVAT